MQDLNNHVLSKSRTNKKKRVLLLSMPPSFYELLIRVDGMTESAECLTPSHVNHQLVRGRSVLWPE